MRIPVRWVPVLLVFAVGSGQAASGDPHAGRQKAETCHACHGAQGISDNPGIPSLAGQTNQFLQWQLVFFRSGRRPNPLMNAVTAELSDEDIRDIGAYFASLPRNTAPAAASANEELAARGRAVVERHRCSACHLDNFRGKAAAASIANQREDYLAKALADYRSAARPSVGVAAMTEAASSLSDEDIAAVAHYLASLPNG